MASTGPSTPQEDHGHHPRTPDSQGTSGQEQPRTFPCPYFVRYPGYKASRRTNCRNRWTEIHRLKEHILNRHYSPKCPRCQSLFSGEAQLQEHLRSAVPCVVNSQRSSERLNNHGFDQDQRQRLLKKKPRKLTDKQYWVAMYEILFPDVYKEDIPSPFEDEQACTVAAYDSFVAASLSSSPELRIRLEGIIDESDGSSSKASRILEAILEFQTSQIRPKFLGRHPSSSSSSSVLAAPLDFPVSPAHAAPYIDQHMHPSTGSDPAEAHLASRGASAGRNARSSRNRPYRTNRSLGSGLDMQMDGEDWSQASAHCMLPQNNSIGMASGSPSSSSMMDSVGGDLSTSSNGHPAQFLEASLPHVAGGVHGSGMPLSSSQAHRVHETPLYSDPLSTATAAGVDQWDTWEDNIQYQFEAGSLPHTFYH